MRDQQSSGVPAGCTVTPRSSVWRWVQPHQKQHTTEEGTNIKEEVPGEWYHQDSDFHKSQVSWDSICSDSPITFIFASANQIRFCEICRRQVQLIFGIPDLWWTNNCKRANGYFGSETEWAPGDPPIDSPNDPPNNSPKDSPKDSPMDSPNNSPNQVGLKTWAYFEVKQLDRDPRDATKDYHWVKTNIFTRWKTASKQTAVLIFDSPSFLEGKDRPPPTSVDFSNDPFWIYVHIFEDQARQQDSAVWGVRDQIRKLEKQKPSEPGKKPAVDYRIIHDIARHTAHVTETLDVALETMSSIIERQQRWASENEFNLQDQHTILEKFLFHQQLIKNLRHRSLSNEKRMTNEIQLAFNTVAQFDSQTSVSIAKSTKEDSDAMRTIAGLTLIFLPPTFISSVFSMSFFNYDPSRGWFMSPKFWIFWALSLPVTMATMTVWYVWNHKGTIIKKEWKILKGRAGMKRKETDNDEMEMDGYGGA